MPAPLTLEAALRDARDPDPNVRGQAVRCLAAALLAELGDPPPRLGVATAHPRGAEVVAALTRAASDPVVAVRAIAATGLGQLGEPAALELVDPWLADLDPGPDAGHLRECAAITCVLLGLAARPASPLDPADHSATEPDPADRPAAPSAAEHPHTAAAAPPPTVTDPAPAPVPGDLSLHTGPFRHAPEDLSHRTYEAALARLRSGLASEAADLRFQAAGGLIELAGAAAAAPLCAALRAEAHPRVRAALVAALAELDPPGPDVCAVLAPIATDPRAPIDLAFPAALGLAAARDARGGDRLIEALRRPDDRARALEALAALGLAAPRAAVPAALKIARGWLTPAVMRVRAAYALARMSPETGLPLLDAFAGRRSPEVQGALADARAALAALAARDARLDGDAP